MEYPDVKRIKIAFVCSRKKKLDDVVELFNNHDKISDVFAISRPHQRLLNPEDAFQKIGSLNCTKLRPLVTQKTASDETNPNNIAATLDHILMNTEKAEDELLLIIGSFFIMTDVRQYFGYQNEEVD